MTTPFTDIIVLVHNNLPLTRGFVKHLFEHTENFRLIFVDNGSTDSVTDFLKEGSVNKKWILIRSEENLGVIKGRNIGAQYIESDYFLNIDNDQYPKAGWLQGLYELMNQGYDIVGPEAWQLLPPNCRGNLVLGNQSFRRDYYPIKHCSSKNEHFTYIGCGGMLIKKEVYDNIGLFDERYHKAYFEDPDLCFTAIKHGYKLGWKYNCPIDHLAHQTISRQNLFSKNEQFIKSWRKFQKKWYPFFPEPMRMDS